MQTAVVIIDDDPVFREAIRRSLARGGRFRVAAECDRIDVGLEAVRIHQPGLVIVDRSTDPGWGPDTLATLRSVCAAAQVLTVGDGADGSGADGTAPTDADAHADVHDLEAITGALLQLQQQRDQPGTSQRRRTRVHPRGRSPYVTGDRIQVRDDDGTPRVAVVSDAIATDSLDDARRWRLLCRWADPDGASMAIPVYCDDHGHGPLIVDPSGALAPRTP